ncbi:potassium channel family protein [Rossellomorea vietnamensis]|uniref:Potassium channel family protein n=2 Tax=Rossellomorea TaxID=2837508 RepID=A0A5D4K909_9BACI|nr:potassium channel family protein [Rossellomorea vietnamensis]TYR73854.1 potassium channel family protein [Rossellomorea vietnamensis]TYS76065.1 potassium channel family protein [Rossellomorea aquimaris]
MSVSFYQRFLRWPILVRTLVIALTAISAFGILIHIIEPVNFPTIFDGIWWALITTSTVGYGDYVPLTILGRIIAMLLIFLGAGFLTTYFVTLAASTVTTQNAYLEGKASFMGKEHTIIVGWNERSREIIDQLLSFDGSNLVTLIDDSLTENPYKNPRIHFIKGQSFRDDILKKAGVDTAEIAVITADQNKNEIDADMNTVMTLLAMKGINPKLYCVAEILTGDHIANAERAGADEVIQTNKQTSYIIMDSILSKGMSTTILELLNHLKGNNLQVIDPIEECHNKTFQEISNLLLERNIILLGLKKGERTIVNPPLETIIYADDGLLVISTEKSKKKSS